MRCVALSLCLCALTFSQPAAADPALAPGKPAGVHKAQANNLVPIYGGVLLFSAILYAAIISQGSSVPASAFSTVNTTS
jgi:hypothetical protein